ncbi:MAG TPA: hypothetical protein VFW66_02490 [Gemmatimonadales bacterium]|nr:hypothetical protein [Gemmatimonadales bacterium]
MTRCPRFPVVAIAPVLAAAATAVAVATACNRTSNPASRLASTAASSDADSTATARPPDRPTAPPLFSNLGSLHHAVSASADAQPWFDQGLRLIYAFNHEEAIASFREGARRDPDCAMCWWGVAVALGPNINLPMDDKAIPDAMDAVHHAQALASHASPEERDYIAAVAARYSDAKGASRAMLDTAYAAAMGDLAHRYPDDPDAQTLWAESLMDLQPWNYYTVGGTPKGRINDIIAALEGVLARNPNHPGACHYYIHAVEASPTPERGLPCAERLAELMPGAGHLVHMPAHIYMRLGRYADAVRHNVHALAADKALMDMRHDTGPYLLLYPTHNEHFLWSAYTMEGREADALASARKVGDAIPIDVYRGFPAAQFLLPTPYFALARFEKWDELLAAPAPDTAAALRYTAGMWHYTRGLAFTAKGDTANARAELDSVRAVEAATAPDFIVGQNSAKALLGIAHRHLAAELAVRADRRATAVKLLRDAAAMEDSLTYDEPPAWYHPIRQVLGRVLLDFGDARGAELAFREDLRRNRENGWSLGGLAESLRKQGKTRAAAEVDARFKRAWSGADVKIAAR